MSEIEGLSPTGWHVPPALRRAWTAGTVPDEQAWSVEAHLVACAACRQDVRATTTDDDALAGLVDGVLARLVDLPPQLALRRATPTRRALALLGLRQMGAAWATLVVSVLSLATVLDVLATPEEIAGDSGSLGAAAWFTGGGSWVAAIAPVLPAIGVALAYGSGLDQARAITASTPFAGLRIVLWRTAAVLLTAIPAGLAVQVAVAAARPSTSSAPDLVGWLLPSLALTLTTLAVGSVLGTAAGAATVCAVWGAGTLVPLAAGAAPALLESVPPTSWLLTAVAGAAVLVVRRDRLGLAGTASPFSPDPFPDAGGPA